MRVTLPFKEGDTPEQPIAVGEAAPKEAAMAVGSGNRVLVTEDDTVSALTVSRMLEHFGWEYEVVSTAEEALERLQTGDYTLVLMDVQMPGMDGVQATQAIRSGEAGNHNAKIPIVALTAYAMQSDRERFMAAGMDDCLIKPLELDALGNVLDRYS